MSFKTSPLSSPLFPPNPTASTVRICLGPKAQRREGEEEVISLLFPSHMHPSPDATAILHCGIVSEEKGRGESDEKNQALQGSCSCKPVLVSSLVDFQTLFFFHSQSVLPPLPLFFPPSFIYSFFKRPLYNGIFHLRSLVSGEASSRWWFSTTCQLLIPRDIVLFKAILFRWCSTIPQYIIL